MELLVNAHGKTYTVIYDDLDHHIVRQYKWSIQVNGSGVCYARGSEIKNMKNRLYMHRLIMAPLTRSDLIDHANGDGLDNRRCNLRKCTRRQNAYNSKPPKGREYKGVEFYRGRWSPQIIWEGIRIRMGRYDTKEEAISVYDKVAERLHGEFAWLNNRRLAVQETKVG